MMMMNKYQATDRVWLYQFWLGFELCWDSFTDWMYNATLTDEEYQMYMRENFWYTLGQGLSSCWTDE